MSQLKKILIKMQDDGVMELDDTGQPIIPDSVYVESLMEQALEAKRVMDEIILEQECNN